MVSQIVILSLVFGLAYAVPSPKISSSAARNVFEYTTADEVPGFELSVQSEGINLLLHCIQALTGYKSTALAVAVNVIEWLVSNALIVVIGTVLTFGFCKLTGFCTLNYEEYVPVTHFQTLVTPERLESAEKFLVSAFEKYAEKRKRGLQKSIE